MFSGVVVDSAVGVVTAIANTTTTPTIAIADAIADVVVAAIATATTTTSVATTRVNMVATCAMRRTLDCGMRYDASATASGVRHTTA